MKLKVNLWRHLVVQTIRRLWVLVLYQILPSTDSISLTIQFRRLVDHWKKISWKENIQPYNVFLFSCQLSVTLWCGSILRSSGGSILTASCLLMFPWWREKHTGQGVIQRKLLIKWKYRWASSLLNDMGIWEWSRLNTSLLGSSPTDSVSLTRNWWNFSSRGDLRKIFLLRLVCHASSSGYLGKEEETGWEYILHAFVTAYHTSVIVLISLHMLHQGI